MSLENDPNGAGEEAMSLGGAAVLLTIAGYLVYGSWDYFVAGFNGPRPTQLADLDKARKVSDLPSPSVKIVAQSTPFETGLARVSKRYNVRTTQAHYLVVRTGEMYMLVEARPREKGPVFEGELTVWDRGMDSEARAKIEAKYPEVRGKLLPFGLTDSDIGGGLTKAAILPGLLVAIALVLGASGLTARSRAAAHRAALERASIGAL